MPFNIRAIAGEVVVSLMVRDRTALITVQDTGIGMADRRPN
ncbi:hypothetical protein ACOKW7_05065 [Limnospira platensis CENA597]